MRSLKHALLVAGAATLVTVPAVALSFQSAPARAPVASTGLLTAAAQDPSSAPLDGTTTISADASLPTDNGNIRTYQRALKSPEAMRNPGLRRSLEGMIAQERMQIMQATQTTTEGMVASTSARIVQTADRGFALQVPNAALDPTTYAQLAQSSAVTTAAAGSIVTTAVAQGIVSTVLVPLVIVTVPVIAELATREPDEVVVPEPPFPSDISPT